MTPYPLNYINHAIAIAYGKFYDKAQIPTRYEIKSGTVPRPKGPFLALRKYQDTTDHERHWGFLRMRAQCKFRHEEFEMTEQEFFDLWTPDLWSQRGRKPDELVMIREDIMFPWSKDNCLIVTRYQQLCRGKKMTKYKGKFKDLDV